MLHDVLLFGGISLVVVLVVIVVTPAEIFISVLLGALVAVLWLTYQLVKDPHW